MIAVGIPPEQVAAWYEGKKAKAKSVVTRLTKIAALATVPWTGGAGLAFGYKAAQKERMQKKSAMTKSTVAKILASGGSIEDASAYAAERKKEKAKARSKFKKTDIAVGVAVATIATLGAAGVFTPAIGAGAAAGSTGAGAAAGGAGAVGAAAAGGGGIAGVGGLGAVLVGAAKAGSKILDKKRTNGEEIALAPGEAAAPSIGGIPKSYIILAVIAMAGFFLLK